MLAKRGSFELGVGTLSDAQVARGAELVSAALDVLPRPRMVTARQAREAVRILELGRFPTIFHDPAADDPRVPTEVEPRRRSQQAGGLYGEGADAGHTVFAGLVYDRTAAGPDAPQLGLEAKGPVTFVFKDQVLPRATFAPSDGIWDRGKLGAAEDLPALVHERALRDHRVIRDHSEPIFPGIGGAPGPEQLAGLRARYGELLARPDAEAVGSMRAVVSERPEYAGIGYAPSFVEAHLRNPTLSDVAEIRLERRSDQRWAVDVSDELRIQLARLASAAGIPFHDQRPDVPAR